MTVDDAFNYIVAALKQGKPIGQSGYDVHMPTVIDGYLIDSEHMNRDARGYEFRDRGINLSPYFYSAAWDLCRRGILRPGLKDAGQSGVGDNQFGLGYSIASQGQAWISNANLEELAAVIPSRFVALLSTHVARFGPGFLARGTEAVRCYSAHAFLASCAMCGAAAESILLALAGERVGPEKGPTIYQGASGRRSVQDRATDLIPGDVPGYRGNCLTLLTSSLMPGTWDESAITSA